MSMGMGRGGRRMGVRFGKSRGRPPMAMAVEKAKDFKGTLKRLSVYLMPFRLQLLIVFFMAVLSTVFNIISPRIMGKATTELFEGTMAKLAGVSGAGVDFGYIRYIILILAGLYIFSAFFGYLQQYIMAGVTQKIVFHMRRDVNHKLSLLPLKFFDSHPYGEILSRVTNDVDNISSTLQQSLTQLITAVVTLIGIVIMMLTISPALTLVCFIVLPPSFIVTRVVVSRSQKFFAGQQRNLGELSGHVEEMYTGHQVVKAFGGEEQAISRFDEINARLYDTGWRAQFVSGIIMPLMALINNLGYVFVCVVGGIFVTQKTIQIGDVQAFIQYAKQFTRPITQTANIANILQATVASAERVFELLDEAEEIPDSPDAQSLEQPRGEVKFEDVEFSYRADTPLIENMNIDIKQGQTVAIVGPTGAGKTTLVNLLMRFYDIGGGKITVDGIDIRNFRRKELRTIFGMVLQDTWLFNGTIKDNIAYGRENASEAEIIRAAKMAHADYFIRTLPGGYDTVLNEDISNISQGQKQLLAIARALLADPAILILDEATSSVDTRTERYIQKAMTELMQGRTSFVIAHRLSTIRDADLILVMHEGSIIEKGTHDELLEQEGFYADLYQSQFTGSDAYNQAV